jgi:hypothetical protein
MSQTGTTTTHLNLRAGPGTEFPILTLLPPSMPLEVLQAQGDWLSVRAAGQPGFVHRAYVTLAGQGVDPGLVSTRPAEAAASNPANVLLAPGAERRITLGPQAGATDRLVASTWNKYGGLLASLAAVLGIDPAAAVAVLAVEAGGRCFAADGRLIIRFENHLFHDQWGKRNPETFRKHFSFNADKRWTEHRWRPAANQPWREFHGSQDGEWQVFTFARTLDDTAAKLSISMGGPQIVGFNYATLGFESVHQMYDAFSAGERQQIIGFFDFVQGPGSTSRRVLALQQQDFTTFASLYNGPGQAAKYGGQISALCETFRRLRPA